MKVDKKVLIGGGVVLALVLLVGGVFLFLPKKEKVIYDLEGSVGTKEGTYLFYQDEQNYYYFNSSECTIRVLHGGQKMTLQDAINEKVITLKEIKKKYPYEVVAKSTYEHSINDTVVFYRAFVSNEKVKDTTPIKIYENEYNVYKVDPTAEMYVMYQGQQLTYKEAIDQELFTAEDLINANIPVVKGTVYYQY